MRTSFSNSVAHCILILGTAPLACASNGSLDGANVGGSISGPAMGGQTTATSGDTTKASSFGGNTGSGGVQVTTGGGSSGRTGFATGGNASGGADVATQGGNSTTGGASTGGTNTGGKATGGTSAATGGNVNSGGAARSGANTGGKGLGGRASSTGGSSSATGGTSGVDTAGTGGTTPAAGGGTAVRSAGCGKASTLTFGAVPNESASATAASGNGVGFGTGGYLTIQSSGQTRGFAVRLPDNYNPNTPYWLIFGFHWNGGNSAQVDNGGTSGYDWAYYGLQKQSKNGAIFVAPDGLGAGWANSGGRDLTFTDDMVKLIEDNYCVDTTHIISTGFSYGGGMSYEIACARAKVFRAVAIFEGAQLSGCDGGNDPIAYWQMVGTADTTCTEAMATPLRDKFVKNNACTAQNPPQPAAGSLTHTCTNYSGCSAGHPVRWCVHGAGHTPAPIDGSSSLYGPGSASWVPQDLWPWLTSL